jgi:hypothetical protein
LVEPPHECLPCVLRKTFIRIRGRHERSSTRHEWPTPRAKARCAPRTITLDGYNASHRAARELKADGSADTKLRSSKYLTDVFDKTFWRGRAIFSLHGGVTVWPRAGIGMQARHAALLCQFQAGRRVLVQAERCRSTFRLWLLAAAGSSRSSGSRPGYMPAAAGCATGRPRRNAGPARAAGRRSWRPRSYRRRTARQARPQELDDVDLTVQRGRCPAPLLPFPNSCRQRIGDPEGSERNPTRIPGCRRAPCSKGGLEPTRSG